MPMTPEQYARYEDEATMPDAEPHVDLKWSLWTADAGLWEEHGHRAQYEVLAAAFAGERPDFTVYTHPRKEIRSGQVTMREGEATVRFEAVWDSPFCHVPDHITGTLESDAAVDTIDQWFVEHYGYQDGDVEYPIGAQVVATLKAEPGESFEDFMARIDACEDALLAQEKANSERFDQFLSLVFPKP